MRRVDHLNVIVPDPPGLLRTFTDLFELPLAFPTTRLPGFTSGGAYLGVVYEVIRYAPGRPSPVREDAGIHAIACEPEPLAGARSELARRQIPHSPPMKITGRWPAEADTPIFHRTEESGELWTLVGVGGMIGNEVSARRFSRGMERGDGRLAPLVGRISGRMGSGRLAERFIAQTVTDRPFVFLCEFHGFNVPDETHATGLAELASRDGGPLGLVRTHELVITARDAAAEAERWQRLLDPLQPTDPGRWQPGDGPAVRVVEGGEDRIERTVWSVRSLERAADWLREHGMLREGPDGAVGIDPEILQGVNVWLTADPSPTKVPSASERPGAATPTG